MEDEASPLKMLFRSRIMALTAVLFTQETCGTI
jgi:hypothetical protein